MSAWGHARPTRSPVVMAASPPRADLSAIRREVAEGPGGDIALPRTVQASAMPFRYNLDRARLSTKQAREIEMQRREFIAGLGAAAWPGQPAMPVIGFLSSRSRIESEHHLRVFQAGLKLCRSKRGGSAPARLVRLKLMCSRRSEGGANKARGAPSEMQRRPGSCIWAVILMSASPFAGPLNNVVFRQLLVGRCRKPTDLAAKYAVGEHSLHGHLFPPIFHIVCPRF
jgi:hypothetical protein